VQQALIADPPSPPLGHRYAVAGRDLALHRAGSGGPSIVFLPGAGLIGLDFLNVANEIAGSTTAVLYDRAGTGWSDPIALPRTAAAVAEELRALLAAAEIPAPYVLVGHSLGGAYIRRYAQLFPNDVAGLLFLDPAHEGYADFPRQGLLAQLRQALAMAPVLLNLRKFYRPRFEVMLRAWPEGLRQTLIAYHLAAWRKTLEEARNLQGEVLGEIGRGGSLPDVPLIVLTAMGIDPFQAAFMPEAQLRDLNALKALLYEAFARSVPRGESRKLLDAGHSTIHTDRPDAIVLALRDILASVAVR
jgi:pimeloyl-ACP methyl ester carboxylesterase